MDSDQLQEALSYFSSRLPKSKGSTQDYVLALGRPGARFNVDIQDVCAAALVHITDLEVIAQAFKEDKSYGPTFFSIWDRLLKSEQDNSKLKAEIVRLKSVIDHLHKRV